MLTEGQPSKTALVMAVLRAQHRLTTTPPLILDDSHAMQLAGMTSAAEVHGRVEGIIEALARFTGRPHAEHSVRRMAMTTCVRSRFMEDRLAEALSRGVTQLVILGAGLDSLPYRRPDLLRGLRVFEVDHPATQAWKQRRLAEAGVSPPAQLHFVPFDFERQTLADALSQGGVRAEITFFSWLGVQPYLTHDAVMSTLDTLCSFPAGSALVMDVLTNVQTPHPDSVLEGGQKLLRSLGEPFQSVYAPEVFEACLAARGFSPIELVSFRDWFLRYAPLLEARFCPTAEPLLLLSAQRA